MNRLALAAALWLAVACSASTQSKALTTAFISLDAAELGFETFDKQHESDIARTGTSRADIDAKLAAYQAERAKFNTAFQAAAAALLTAYKLEDDKSIAGAEAAVAALVAELTKLGGH